MHGTHSPAGLKFYRQRAGLSGAELANVIGLHVNSYYRIEAGNRALLFDKACALADRLNITLEQLRRIPDDIVVSPDGSSLAGWDTDS